MLVKEYRISLPMSVAEYRIAQLYMIQKKSREESHGAGSGVEIITNEPYTDGPGGSGQYTNKIYHIGSHLPGWFRAILPTSALRVNEEAWNAYPYTKTRYTCPFVEKFVLEVETKYLNDGGKEENMFSLSSAELKERTVDYIDICKDPISSGDYKKEEDPKLFVSKCTNRGPLSDNWRDEYIKATKMDQDKKIMTAYKLCRVEFKYWGMQNKIERFIHDIGLRKTMLRAHRQAWCWQDEYYGLQLSDIRKLELETQIALQEKMADVDKENDKFDRTDSTRTSKRKHMSEVVNSKTSTLESQDSPKHVADKILDDGTKQKCPSILISSAPDSSSHSLQPVKSKSSLDSSVVSEWRFQSLEQLQESSSDEEFYDAQGVLEYVFSSCLELSDSESDASERLSAKAISMENLFVSNDEFADARSHLSFEQESYGGRRFEKLCQKYSLETGSYERQPKVPPLCSTNVLVLVFHGGSLLDTAYDHFNTSKRSDYNTLKTTFDNVIKNNYQAARGHIALRLVPCPQICTEALSVLSSLSPFGFDAMTPNSWEGSLPFNQEFVPLGAVCLFAACNPEYQDHINSVIAKANLVYSDFIQSDEGKGFTGQVCIIADQTGSILAYDALCHMRPLLSSSGSHYGSHSSDIDEDGEKNKSPLGSTNTLCQKDQVHNDADSPQLTSSRNFKNVNTTNDENMDNVKVKLDKSERVSKRIHEMESAKIALKKTESLPVDSRHSGERSNAVRLKVVHSVKGDDMKRTSSGSQYESQTFVFDVTDLFMLGSTLGLVLAYRKIMCATESKKYVPLRPDCQQIYNLFHARDPSAFRIEPLLNSAFQQIHPIKIARYNKFPMGDGESIQIVSSKWWGNKRIDYMLYCPDVLHSFPMRALPQLFHASCWESTDIVAFVLRQVLQQDFLLSYQEDCVSTPTSQIVPEEHQPKEKWQKKRTMYKVRNLQSNHRGNDVLVLEDKPQILSAKFMYGPLDMTSLSGEKTDIYVMSSSGEWICMGTEITDGHGRLTFKIPEEKRVNQGIHPVKMVVRVDHTTADLCLAVLPAKTETIIFSIDGSFTASVSIMGTDPKVKPGAVDVVRHWQELGYLILYVTARPDLQHNKVVAWLAQHNFPHGMVAFMDGFSKDPLRQKFNYLKSLHSEADLSFRAGYGSSKDVNGYRDLGLPSNRIFIVGKANKKQQNLATFITDGYAAHLEDLLTPGGSRPAIGNAVFLLCKTCFSLPSSEKRNSKNRPVSITSGFFDSHSFGKHDTKNASIERAISDQGTNVILGNNIIQPIAPSFGAAAARSRGTSPRPKMTLDPPS